GIGDRNVAEYGLCHTIQTPLSTAHRLSCQFNCQNSHFVQSLVIFGRYKNETLPRHRLNIFLLLLISLPALTQDIKRYSFTHYGSAEGVISNEVIGVVQDDAGYIWVGSTNGLQRYDGIRFISFRNRKNDTS